MPQETIDFDKDIKHPEIDIVTSNIKTEVNDALKSWNMGNLASEDSHGGNVESLWWDYQ